MLRRVCLLVFLLFVVPCQPYIFNAHLTLGAKDGRASLLPSFRTRPATFALSMQDRPSETQGGVLDSVIKAGHHQGRNTLQILRGSASAMAMAMVLTMSMAPQSADAYFQTSCLGGVHLNHLRGNPAPVMTSTTHEYAPQAKSPLLGDRCPAFPCDDTDVVSVASSLEDVLSPSVFEEDHLPRLIPKSIEDLGTLENMGLAFVASAFSTMTMHPVDTLKTRIQRKKGSNARGSGHKHTEDGGLYNGLLANVAREGPCNAMYLGVYEAVKKGLFINPATTGMAQHWPMMTFLAAGAIGDAAGCLVSLPAEIVKRKVQSGVSRGYLEAIVDSVRTDSARAMTLASANAVFVRDIPEGALQMALYEEWKLKALPVIHATLPMLDAFLVDGLLGAAAGGIAATVTTPFDVVLTRLSTGAKGGRGMGVGECLQKILKEEGMAGLWKGAGHRAGYYAPLIGLFFGVYGWLQSLAVDEGKVNVMLHSVPVPLWHVVQAVHLS